MMSGNSLVPHPSNLSPWLIGIPILLVLILFPVIGVPNVWLFYMFLFFIYLSLANMWNLLAGYSGLISLCPAAFIGLGGYTLAILTWVGIPYYVGIICGAVVAGLFAIIISFPLFRLKGIYFAIGTLIIPEILRFLFLLWAPIGAPTYGKGSGYSVKNLPEFSDGQFYWIALIIGVGTFFLVRYIVRSKFGLGLAAIRDNDSTADSCGIKVTRLKLWTFIISASVTALAGAIFYLYRVRIEPSSAFSIQWVIMIMLATVIGGERTVEGPIIGTAIVVVLYFVLARYAEYSLIVEGIILIFILLLVPQGIAGLIRKTQSRYSLFKFIKKPG
jgi:branched-chain amino acid transport system permease protein